MSAVRERVIAKGFSEKDLSKCIEVYSNDDVWMTAGANQSILRWLRIDDADDSDEDL